VRVGGREGIAEAVKEGEDEGESEFEEDWVGDDEEVDVTLDFGISVECSVVLGVGVIVTKGDVPKVKVSKGEGEGVGVPLFRPKDSVDVLVGEEEIVSFEVYVNDDALEKLGELNGDTVEVAHDETLRSSEEVQDRDPVDDDDGVLEEDGRGERVDWGVLLNDSSGGCELVSLVVWELHLELVKDTVKMFEGELLPLPSYGNKKRGDRDGSGDEVGVEEMVAVDESFCEALEKMDGVGLGVSVTSTVG